VPVINSYARDNVLQADRSLVVDLGAGNAPYRPLFKSNCRRYLACDLEPGDGVDLVFDGATPIDLADASADCVVSFQVLEHIWDVGAYLAECRRLLSQSGRLLLSTHGTWLFHPHPQDFRRWTRDGLVKELEENGFSVVSIAAAVGPLAWTTQFRTLAYAHVLEKFGLVGRVMSGILCTFMNLRMRIEDAITPVHLRETNAAVYLIDARPTPQA